MDTIHKVGLITQTTKVPLAQAAAAASALQVQAMRDLAPVWNTSATIQAFADPVDLPTDHWPMIIQDQIPQDAQGVHLDNDLGPFALVKYSPDWALTCSHELLEMLCDPLGDRFQTAPHRLDPSRQVDYLVEVCDPSEDWDFGYDIDGFRMSDFYLPAYFDPTAPGPYSHTGAITAPLEVPRNGYISWFDHADGHYYQWRAWEPEGQQLIRFPNAGDDEGGSARDRTNGPTTVPWAAMHRTAEAGRTAAPVTDGPRQRRARTIDVAIQRVIAAIQ